jgi:hypothetical protein
VNAEQPYKTFRDMVAYAKGNPGKINYATGNTTGIMSFGQMNSLAGIDMTHVPYKGEPQAVTDIIAGRVQLLVGDADHGLAHLKDGKLRALATNLKIALQPAARGADHGRGRHPAVLGGLLGALYGPGKLPRELQHAPEQGIPRRDEAARGDRADGQAGLPDDPQHADELGRFTKAQLEAYRGDHEIHRHATGVRR